MIDQATCRLYVGGTVEVELEDRVYPDRTCGQYEAGWWVYDVDVAPDKHPIEYFMSESGILYDFDIVSGSFTHPCGIWPKQARRIREQEAKDELIERSFDAYR
jgi:hypothetical protein